MLQEPKTKNIFSALNLTLNPKQDCTLETCNYVISSIFAVWWGKNVVNQEYWQRKAEEVGRTLSEQRLDLMENLHLPVRPEQVLIIRI